MNARIVSMNARTIMKILSMAVCEWFLITIMFIDAALGFVLTKFAHYCRLQTPCLFCLRLDRFFGNEEDSRPHLSLFCGKHRAEISYLISCEVQDKLVDVREMCDDCYTSKMVRNEYGPESNRIVTCSCCKREREVRSSGQRLIQQVPVPVQFEDSKVTVKPPVPCVAARRLVVRPDNFKRARNNVGDTELKFNSNSDSDSDSDSDSEIQVSDDDNANLEMGIAGKSGSEGDSAVIDGTNGQTQDRIETKHFHTVSDPEPSHLDVQNDENITGRGSIGHESAKAKETGPLEVENDLSNSDEIHDKTDNGYESPGGSSVSEIEGESLVDRLNRQVEYDRKHLRLLRTELEEERNAADIAANEAMAMITRLQEEKSALHTEALQYLRMVEEQAEYDMEALDKANDLVDQKDKDIQDLEAELEYFRSRYDDELTTGNTENSKAEHNPHLENGKIETKSSSNSKFTKVIDPEDEKRYILKSLSELEKKFQQFSSQNGTQPDHLKDENNFSRHKDSSKSNGTKRVSIDGELDVGTLGNEISDLNERLEALEADRDFLEHACNALQSNGGFQLIQEVAQQLQDLRRIRFDR